MAQPQPAEPAGREQTERKISDNGHGILQIREIVQALNKIHIPSCLVGVSASMYYGARRVRQSWDICVPTAKFSDAVSLLKRETYATKWKEVSHLTHKGVYLFDTYPAFKLLAVEHVYFRVVSAQAAHITCEPSNFEWSKQQLPYPKLVSLVQSVIDTQDGVGLEDVVDGMDLSEQWGLDYLELSSYDNSLWADWANARIKVKDPGAKGFLVCGGAFDRKKRWQGKVKGKQTRLGFKFPKERYATRFRSHGSPDPRTLDRSNV